MKKAIIWLLSIILISFSYSLNNARMTIQMNPGNKFDSFEFTNDPIIEIGQ